VRLHSGRLGMWHAGGMSAETQAKVGALQTKAHLRTEVHTPAVLAAYCACSCRKGLRALWYSRCTVLYVLRMLDRSSFSAAAVANCPSVSSFCWAASASACAANIKSALCGAFTKTTAWLHRPNLRLFWHSVMCCRSSRGLAVPGVDHTLQL
jgi:hypothetical protein